MDQSAVGITTVLLICLFFGVYCPSTEEIIRDEHSVAVFDLKITLIMLNIFMHYTPPRFLSNEFAGFLLLIYIYIIFTSRVVYNVDPDQLAS